jgi:hypothetical protein
MNTSSSPEAPGATTEPDECAIRSVTEAIDIVCDSTQRLSRIYDQEEERRGDPQYPYPFGLWFRGLSRAEYKLVPSVFRHPAELASGNAWYDEGMMIQHHLLREPPKDPASRSTFDVLCMLQHYQLPTRLLDWTESVLVALYFAVQGDGSADGRLHALNARRLNARTRLHDAEEAYICGSTSIDVVVRSEMARARRKKDIQYAFCRNSALAAIKQINQKDNAKFQQMGICWLDKWMEGELSPDTPDGRRLFDLLRCPVAVFPNRLNPRMSSQLSMILIFGGKVTGSSETREADGLPVFDEHYNALDVLNQAAIQDGNPAFLETFKVPAECKSRIRDDLKKIGIHEAALFPDIEHIGNYVRREWALPR